MPDALDAATAPTPPTRKEILNAIRRRDDLTGTSFTHAVATQDRRWLLADVKRLEDAAEMLWVVLANVSDANWGRQSADWQAAAARWRDAYFAAVGVTAPEDVPTLRLAPAIEMKYRRLLWLTHGHGGTALYGDDGEMQCHECAAKYHVWDYKRAPLDVVEAAHGRDEADTSLPEDRLPSQRWQDRDRGRW